MTEAELDAVAGGAKEGILELPGYNAVKKSEDGPWVEKRGEELIRGPYCKARIGFSGNPQQGESDV